MTTIAAPLPRGRPRGIDLSRPVMLGLAAVLCVLIVLPVSQLAWHAVVDRDGAPTLENFRRLWSDPAFVEPMLTTLTLATSVSVACCVVAAPIGWLVARTDLPFTGVVRALVMASFVTPPFLGAVAWEILAAPNSGLLNQWYRSLTGAGTDEYLVNVYSMGGLIFVIACYTFPYVFVLVSNALDRIPSDLEDASAILGGRTWRTAARITIPLALPALLAGGLVAFLQAMILFGSPAILALPAGFHTMTTKIWSLFQYPPKPGLAAAAALPLLLITIVLLRGQQWLMGRRGYTVVGGRSGRPRPTALGLLRWPALGLCLAVLACSVFLPYGALVKTAFSRVPSQPVSFDNLTLQHVRFVLFEFSGTRLALQNTFLLGVLSATLGTGLALVVAYLSGRRAVPGHRTLAFLATAPVSIPGIVLGVGLFLSYTRPPFVLYGTLWILLIAYITIELPAAYQQLQSALKAVHPELEEASRILGATRLQALGHVTAPLLRSGVIAAWCFVFIGTMRELSAAIMLFTADTKVISVVIFDLNESGDLGAISVLGIAMLLITFAVVLLVNRIPGLGGWRPARPGG
ncbi:MAG: iron ABC transporter permease [Alphaproteobacteria bacterium]|nr:iron ABC transporter permease [Alphaproteobacteria bacterium]